MTTKDLEYLELKKMLGQLSTMISMLIPAKVSVSYLTESTCKSRQAIRQYLHNNFEPDKDYWNEGGKIFVSKEVAISILSKANKKNMTAQLAA